MRLLETEPFRIDDLVPLTYIYPLPDKPGKFLYLKEYEKVFTLAHLEATELTPQHVICPSRKIFFYLLDLSQIPNYRQRAQRRRRQFVDCLETNQEPLPEFFQDKANLTISFHLPILLEKI